MSKGKLMRRFTSRAATMNRRSALGVLAMAVFNGAGATRDTGLAEVPRAKICLNGSWETVFNSPGDKMPAAEWSVRRAPAMPFAGNPPTTSVWYRRTIQIPTAWAKADRRFFLSLEKAGHYAAVHWNGRFCGEHYGQYTPFEADVTREMRFGEPNEIAIFVHNASGRYVRPDAEFSDPLVGNAYRGATEQDFQRNWVGIVGDIFLGWHPPCYIADVFVIPSVRKRRIEARVEVAGAGSQWPGLTTRAAVLDEGRIVRRLPEKPVAGGGAITLAADWRDPELWGPEPYGKAKLYVLRTELMSRGKLVDRCLTRFGFREVWVEGRDALLNGKKLWMAGTYFNKLAPIRYLNDCLAQSRVIQIMQASGLNTLHGHWDELGQTWLDLADEMGMLVLGGFYCDGRPNIQSRADPGWLDWMAATCREWVRTFRNHPSIVVWRPADVLPQNLFSQRETVYGRLAEQVRREDGTRPLADGSDIAAWGQGAFRDPRNPQVYDDGSRMAERLAASRKPFLTKEIWTGFADVENLSRFFRVFYEKSFSGGGTGIMVQHLPLIQRAGAFHIEWLSESGLGNRDPAERIQDIDRVGVDIELLSCPVVYTALDRHLPELCLMVNDALAASCRGRPDRFQVFAHLPFNDRATALAEMSRCLDQPEFVGVVIPSSIDGCYLDGPRFDWFWEAADRRGVPVFLHPSILSCDNRVLELVSRPFESTVAVARLICRGLYDRFPNLILVVAHLGGALPYLAHRIDLGFEMPVPSALRWEVSRPPTEHMKKLYVDTAMGWSPAVFRCARELVGIDQIVFGTDYFIRGARFMERTLELLDCLGISPAGREKILHENAARILRLGRTKSDAPGGRKEYGPQCD